MRYKIAIVAFSAVLSCQTEKTSNAPKEQQRLPPQYSRLLTAPTTGPDAPYVPTQMDYLVNTLNSIYAATSETIGWKVFVSDGRDVAPNTVRIQILNLHDTHVDKDVLDEQVAIILSEALRVADEKGWGWVNLWLLSRVEGEDRVARVCLKDAFIAGKKSENPPAILWVRKTTSHKYVPISPPGSKSCRYLD